MKVCDVTEDLFGKSDNPTPQNIRPEDLKLSVLLPLVDHGEVDKIVNALAKQTVNASDYEVIVVDDLQSGHNQQHLSRISKATADCLNLRVFQIAGRGRANATNVAVAQAKSDLLLLLAADFIPAPNLVEAHLKFHQEHLELHMVGIGPGLFPASVRSDPFACWLEDTGRLFGVSFTKANVSMPVNYFYGGNTSIKRSFLTQAGPFDEAFPYDTTDDHEIGIRLGQLGMQAVYLPEPKTYHDHPITLQERRQQMRNAGRSAVIFEAKHPHLSARMGDCQTNAQEHHKRARHYRLKYLISRRQEYLEKYWINILAAEFMTEYEKANRQT